MQNIFRLMLLCGLAGLPLSAAGVDAVTPPDVRVLIDISGSMKQNDPANLRRPALRMLVGLLQPGTRAGVWSFARWTNMLVPLDEVDEAWKARAISLSEQIGSPGQFTNIEAVLDKATRDWSGVAATQPRHVVLLTDGMVDVVGEAAEDAASRRRILGPLRERLQAQGTKVHTLALSDRADHALLERLANDTGGWYQQVDSADELQRVFLRIFEKVGKPASLPLEGNVFRVDKAVKEATLLVFRAPGSPPAVLYAPDGSRFTDSDILSGVAWFRDEGYELITLANPAPGEWRLEADVDPDNRVMVVTDLRLAVKDVPNQLERTEPLLVEAALLDKGEVVKRKAFLDIITLRAQVASAAGAQPLTMNDRGASGDRRAQDGVFGARTAEALPAGELELIVGVDSETFNRERRFLLNAEDAAAITLTEAMAGDGWVAELTLNGRVMAPGAQLELWQTQPDGARLPLAPLPAAGDAAAAQRVLRAAIPNPALGVMGRVAGETRLGHALTRELGPVFIAGQAPPSPPPAPPPAPQTPQPEQEQEPEQAPEQPSEPAPAAPEPATDVVEEPEEESGSWLPYALLIGGNLLLIGGGAGLWWFLKRRRRPAAINLLDDDDDGKAPEGQA